MNWIIVKKVPLETDLSMVIGYLRERGIAHQIYEEAGEQVLSVTNPHIVDALLKLLDGVEQGSIHFESTEKPVSKNTSTAFPSFGTQVKDAPITVWLILLSVLGACFIEFDVNNRFVHWLTFQNFTLSALLKMQFVPFATSIANGEVWRLLTPVFLHFGFFHVLFNSMWMWDLGRRLEFLLGKKWYLIFFLVTGVVSNVAQYLWVSSSLFGGMSGVVYALVGFIIVSHKLAPHPLTAVAPGVLGFMLVWLVVCATGVIDHFVGGSVANAAHVGGLVAGAVFALVFVIVFKLKKRVRDYS